MKNKGSKSSFIGRKSELDSFRTIYDKFLREENADSSVILLMYSGDGGIGKSSLISRLEEELDSRNSNYVHIDCNKLEDDVAAMIELAGKLNEECGIRLPKFMNKVNDYLIACGRIESSEMSETVSGLASKLADEFAGGRVGMAVEGVSWLIKKIKKTAIKDELKGSANEILERRYTLYLSEN